jgi:hypothetical protein
MFAGEVLSNAMLMRSAEDRRVDDLRSILIVSFETAVERGMEPAAALAVILEWAAAECARLREAGPRRIEFSYHA